jgi:hypothetical protein
MSSHLKKGNASYPPKSYGGGEKNIRSLKDGVFEFKVKYGPGYRVYFAEGGQEIILLLLSGDKRSRNRRYKKSSFKWFFLDLDFFSFSKEVKWLSNVHNPPTLRFREVDETKNRTHATNPFRRELSVFDFDDVFRNFTNC